MTAMEKFNLVKRACDEQKACQLQYKDETAFRTIFPLGICLTFNRGMVIVGCVQESSTTKETLLKNFPMEDCDNIRILERKFTVWPDFKKAMKICDDWLFHVNPE